MLSTLTHSSTRSRNLPSTNWLFSPGPWTTWKPTPPLTPRAEFLVRAVGEQRLVPGFRPAVTIAAFDQAPPMVRHPRGGNLGRPALTRQPYHEYDS
jgi:hypothetical protein